MSKKKSITKNYIYNTSYQVLTLLTPLITTPYLSRVLGADGIGIYSFTASIVAYFTMFAALGTLTYGNREISYLQDDRKTRSQVFWEIEFLSIIMTSISLLAYILFILFGAKEYHVFYIAQIFTLLSTAADIVWLLQGMEEFGKVVGRNIFFKIILIVYIFTFVRTKEDLIIYVAGNVLITFISQLSVWLYLPKFVDAPKWRELKPFRHLKNTIILFLPTIAISIYIVLDKTMIGIFSNSFENGYYEQGLMLSKTVLTLVTSLGAVMIPRMGYYYNRGEHEEVKNLMYQSYKFVWFLGIPLSFGLMGIAANVVPWFYGDGFLKLITLLPILSLLIPIIGLSNVTGIQYLVTTKRERILTMSVCIGAAVNFCLNLCLIPRWSSLGAAFASVIAEAVITGVQFIFVRKEISITKVFLGAWKYLLAGFLMLALLIIENKYLSPSIIHTGLMIISGAVVYFMALIIMRDEFTMGYIKKIIHK